MWVLIMIGLVILKLLFHFLLVSYERNRYIPVEERMQSCIPGYVPWSKDKRKEYYDREVLQMRLDDISTSTPKRKYHSTIETGYYDRRY